jgi:hypothetical protein
MHGGHFVPNRYFFNKGIFGYDGEMEFRTKVRMHVVVARGAYPTVGGGEMNVDTLREIATVLSEIGQHCRIEELVAIKRRVKNRTLDAAPSVALHDSNNLRTFKRSVNGSVVPRKVNVRR